MINKLAVLYSSIDVKIEPSNTVNSVNLIYCKFGDLHWKIHLRTTQISKITAGIPIIKLRPTIPRSCQ